MEDSKNLPLPKDESEKVSVLPNDARPSPVKTLIEIMGRPIVVVLALGAVVGATTLCAVAIFRPTLFSTNTARFFLCLLIAFLFSVFVFTLFPTDYKIDVGKIISIPAVLVGPAALWIVLFLLIWNLLPQEPVAGKVFRSDSSSPSLYAGTTWVLKWSPATPKYNLLQTATGDSNIIPLDGFYIEFDGANDKYTAEIGTGPDNQEIKKRYTAEFYRGASTYTLSAVKEEQR